MRVAVVGARGQLGAAVVHEFASAHEVVPFAHDALDVADDAAVAATMAAVRPDAIVDAAAYTNVDGAEDHPIEALNGNAFGARALARAATALDATLVYYSTDFVFDGTASAPYTETDRPNPQSVYAASKLLGEWFAIEAPHAYVLRVESLFGRAPGGGADKGSLAGIVRTLLAGEPAKVFVDRTVSPTYVIDAARATRQLLEMAAPAGLYHCVNSGTCTWFEIAEASARLLGIEPRLLPVSMADLALKAARPKYCALSNAKLQSVGIEMPRWQDALARHLQTLRHEVRD